MPANFTWLSAKFCFTIYATLSCFLPYFNVIIRLFWYYPHWLASTSSQLMGLLSHRDRLLFWRQVCKAFDYTFYVHNRLRLRMLSPLIASQLLISPLANVSVHTRRLRLSISERVVSPLCTQVNKICYFVVKFLMVPTFRLTLSADMCGVLPPL